VSARPEDPAARDAARREGTLGGLFALGAFGIWGMIPLYFKAIGAVPLLEVVAHRILWSAVFLLLAVALVRRGGAIVTALSDRRARRALLATTLLISVNWVVFIYAISADRVLESSLGYYINPLVSVLLGVLVLGERLSVWRTVAVAMAAVGVLVLAVGLGGFPWVSLALAFTFGFYGLIRKTVNVGALEGLTVETALVAPVALAYLAVLGWRGSGAFAAIDLETDVLLALAGLVTAVPLFFFASAARRLRLSTVGFFQYIAPTCNLLLAVFVFGEPFTRTHLITFLFIWAALAIVMVESLARGTARGVPRVP
jgi:chloramphenicol-sensitive protein RarD